MPSYTNVSCEYLPSTLVSLKNRRDLANKQFSFWSNSAFIFPSLCLRLALFLCLSLSLRGCVPSARAVPRSKRLCLSMHFIPDFNKVYISETSVTITYTRDNIIRKYLFPGSELSFQAMYGGPGGFPWRCLVCQR